MRGRPCGAKCLMSWPSSASVPSSVEWGCRNVLGLLWGDVWRGQAYTGTWGSMRSKRGDRLGPVKPWDSRPVCCHPGLRLPWTGLCRRSLAQALGCARRRALPGLCSAHFVPPGAESGFCFLPIPEVTSPSWAPCWACSGKGARSHSAPAPEAAPKEDCACEQTRVHVCVRVHVCTWWGVCHDQSKAWAKQQRERLWEQVAFQGAPMR